MDRLGVIGDLLSFIVHGKRWWLAPLLLMIVLATAFVIVAESSMLAPFLYPLF